MGHYPGVAHKETVLYRITNKLNGKRYIGVTCRGLSVRMTGHLASARRNAQKNSTLHKALRKYGIDAFAIEPIATYRTYAEALAAERAEIAATAPEYNCTVGGDGTLGFRFSEEDRRLMSKKRKGRPGTWIGRRHSAESICKMSESTKGQPGYWKGKKLPEHVAENLKRIREARTDKWRVLPLGPKSQRKRVVCLNDGRDFESCLAASRFYGCGAGSIVASCKKKPSRQTAIGRVFRYFGEHHGGKEEADRILNEAYQAQRGISRPVRCLTDGREFPSIKQAAEHYGIPLSTHTIAKCCRQNGSLHWRRALNGLRFVFAEASNV